MLLGTETQSALWPKYPLPTRPTPAEKAEFAEEVAQFGGDAQPCSSGTQALREKPVSDLAWAAAWFWGVSIFGTGKIMVLRSHSQALLGTTPPKKHQVDPGARAAIPRLCTAWMEGPFWWSDLQCQSFASGQLRRHAAWHCGTLRSYCILRPH